MSTAELQKLWQESNRPGADKFVQVARRQGIALSRKEATEFIQGQSVAQVFKPGPKSTGKVAARGLDTNWQIDLASLTQLPAKENDGYRYIFMAVNVFDRKCFAEPLKDKKPESTASALLDILKRAQKPEIISTDDAGEFTGPFDLVLKHEGIVHKIKDSEDRNAIAVVDRCIGTIKNALFDELVAHNTHRWVDFVKLVVQQYNNRPHEGIQGGVPNDVRHDKTLQFRLTQENAQKILHNERNHNKQVSAIETAGAFREPMEQTDFQRGFKPRNQSEVHTLASVEGGVAVSTTGHKVPLKRAIPVPVGSANVPIPQYLAMGDAERDRRAKEKLAPFVPILKAYLGNEAKWTGPVAAYMRQQPGFTEALSSLRLVSFSSFLRLFPEDFVLETGEKGGNSKVRAVVPAEPAVPAVPDRRLRRKTPAEAARAFAAIGARARA